MVPSNCDSEADTWTGVAHRSSCNCCSPCSRGCLAPRRLQLFEVVSLAKRLAVVRIAIELPCPITAVYLPGQARGSNRHWVMGARRGGARRSRRVHRAPFGSSCGTARNRRLQSYECPSLSLSLPLSLSLSLSATDKPRQASAKGPPSDRQGPSESGMRIVALPDRDRWDLVWTTHDPDPF